MNSKTRRPRFPFDLDLGVWDFGFRRGPDLSRQAMLTLLVLLVLIWLGAGAYLLLVSRTMIAARHVQSLRDRLASLHKENAALEREIAVRQEVGSLLGMAGGMGFVFTAPVEFVEPR